MSLPLIGVTPYQSRSEAGYPTLTVQKAYMNAVMQAGGLPVILPVEISREGIETIAARMDGILFTGGGDLRPQVYSSHDHPKVDGVDDARDQMEFNLVHWLEETGKPFFGICRGIQLVNAALGGTLYEDILDQRPGALQHDHSDNARNHLAHPVEVAEGSRLKEILGASKVEVNSLHHQGVRQLAPGVRATAFSPDGLVEAIEVPGHRFGLAVQWHPEWLQEHPPMRLLFQAFVQAAGSH